MHITCIKIKILEKKPILDNIIIFKIDDRLIVRVGVFLVQKYDLL